MCAPGAPPTLTAGSQGELMKKANGWVWRVGPVMLALFLSSPLAGQDFRGSIAGTITDTTGSVLPGATVIVTNEGTQVSANIQTDVKGSYQARYLISGTYSVTARLDGFKTAVRKGIPV